MYKIQFTKDGRKWSESPRRFDSRETAFLYARSWIMLGMSQMTRVVKSGKIFAEYHKVEEE